MSAQAPIELIQEVKQLRETLYQIHSTLKAVQTRLQAMKKQQF